MEWCRTTKTGFRLRPQGARLRAGGGGEEAVVRGMWEGGRSGVDWQAQAVQAEDVRSLRPHQAAVLRAGVGGEEAVVLGLREGEGGGAPSEAEEEEVRRLRLEGPLL